MQAQKYLRDLGLGMFLQIFLVGMDVVLRSHHNHTAERIFHKHAWQGKVPEKEFSGDRDITFRCDLHLGLFILFLDRRRC